MRTIAVVFSVLLVGTTWADEEPKVGDLKTKPITLEDRAGNEVEAERGRLMVPENRNDKKSRLIEIAFVRVRHPGKKSGPPTFLLAGGPGGSGISMIQRIIAAEDKRILDYFGGDIIGVDQRGTGLSKPNLRTSVKYKLPLDEPGDPKKMLARINKVCAEVAKSERERGVDLSGYTTVESADDIDALRAVLGYEKMNLWGGSYGSHLAFAVIRRHDKHLARVIIQSPEGPDHTFKLPSQIQEGLERVSALVAKDPIVGKKMPDMVKSLETVLARLDKKPVKAEIFYLLAGGKVEVGISKFDVQIFVANALGRVRTMRDVPLMIHSMQRGDFTRVAQQAAAFRTFAGPRSSMSMMMDSASGASPERLRRMEREAKTCVLGDAINFPYPGVRAAWGNPDLGKEFRGPLRSDVPVLFFCGDIDSRTPIRNAREVMKGLPNSQMIEVVNGAHDFSIPGTPKLRKAAGDFLHGRTVELRRVELPAPKFIPIRE